MLKLNMGSLDRVLRIVLGSALLILFVVYWGAGWNWLGLIGLVPLATGIFGKCPVYSVFGLSTRGSK